MAKKYKSVVDGYKSKNRDRKRRGTDIASLIGASAHSFGLLTKTSPKKKRQKTTKRTVVNLSKRQKTEQDYLTPIEALQGFIALIVLGFVGIISIEIILNIGFKGLLIFVLSIIILFITGIIIINQKKRIRESKLIQQKKQWEIDENQIAYLQSLLDKIDKYQAIINNSEDINDVKKNLDWLLAIMDEIMSYDEEILRNAGLTKETMPQQKEIVLKNYDVVLKQAQERYDLKFANNTKIPQTTASVPTSKNTRSTEPFITDSNSTSKDILVLDKNNEDIPSLESRIYSSFPSKQGLYPHEILMLSYAHTYKVSHNNFQGFWYYLYSVEEPQALLASLYERSFITIGDLESTIEKLKVTELKEELLSIGEKTTGLKANLVSRLIEKGDLNFLSQKYQERYYKLTEKGCQELKNNEYVSYLHKTKYMSVWEMNRFLYDGNCLSLGYRDILWREFNTQCDEHFKTRNFGLYRNTRMHMYQFLMEEKKYQSALSVLCEIVAYDLSGLGNNEPSINDFTIDKYILEQKLEMGFPYSKSLYTIPPVITGWIEDIKEFLNMNDDKFRTTLLENFERISLYRRIFTNEECVDIVMNEIGHHSRKQSAIYCKAEERLKAELASMR